MRESKKENLLIPGIENIVNFIHKATSDSNCIPSVLKAAIGLLGDLGATYGSRMHQIFSQPYITQLLQEGRQYDDMTSIVNYTQSIVHQIRTGK